MNFRSIQWRLQAWHGFLLVVLVTGLLTGFYIFERREKLQAIDNELLEALGPLLPRAAPPGNRPPEGRPPGRREPGRPPRPEPDGPPPGPEFRRPPGPLPGDNPLELRELEARFFASGRLYFIIWNERGDRLAAATNAPAALTRPDAPRRAPGRGFRSRADARELVHFAPGGRVVLVGAPLAPLREQLRQLAFALGLIGVGVVGLGLIVGWWLAARALQPLEDITRTAGEIAAGDLSRRINTAETESELGQLAAVLNATFARLEAAFTQQKQFTSDAAHELRTPVTVILSQIQSTLNRERSAPEYRETLEACQRAAQRMRRLIEALLELARLDAGHGLARREPLDFAAVAAECVELVRPLAVERNVTLHADLRPAPGSGDPDQLALVVTNLLTNAVHYHRPGGEVRVATTLEKDGARMTVADNGPGIAPGHLPRIFDRFYRADAARTSAQGRTGLGLAITKSIVEAHGGSITVTSEPGCGTTFTVRLPPAG